jgi:hypothetical protein
VGRLSSMVQWCLRQNAREDASTSETKRCVSIQGAHSLEVERGEGRQVLQCRSQRDGAHWPYAVGAAEGARHSEMRGRTPAGQLRECVAVWGTGEPRCQHCAGDEAGTLWSRSLAFSCWDTSCRQTSDCNTET